MINTRFLRDARALQPFGRILRQCLAWLCILASWSLTESSRHFQQCSFKGCNRKCESMAILPVHPRRGEMNQAGHVSVWKAGLEGRKKDSSGRSPEIRETMNESPERAKDTGNFRLFRPCRGSCYDDCATPCSRPEHLSDGLSGLHSKSRDPKVTRTPDYTQF